MKKAYQLQVVIVCIRIGTTRGLSKVKKLKTHEEDTTMKTKQMMVMGLAALCVIALAGEASARGGKSGSKGQGTNTGVCTQTGAAGTSASPAGSQRRDGTFLTTGTTANGGTTRPSNGNGLQDGSHLTTPAVAPVVTVVAP